ncbi:hypothetical protein [Pararhizobium sp. DWP3-4]|uniref:hypothetical protein n=1 Tax=Pararhizobium sp. DWP3-4 TaxID=2804565 RepID=UPI003CEB6195
MKTIGMLVFEGVQSLDVSGPLDVFAEANAFIGPDRHYEIKTIGPSDRHVTASNGMMLASNLGYGSIWSA